MLTRKSRCGQKMDTKRTFESTTNYRVANVSYIFYKFYSSSLIEYLAISVVNLLSI